MPVSEFHGQVAAIALRAAAPHGFALGGGNALIAHGVIDRFTQDVDVFSDEEGGVEAAADASPGRPCPGCPCPGCPCPGCPCPGCPCPGRLPRTPAPDAPGGRPGFGLSRR